jgi:hypothetical protein
MHVDALNYQVERVPAHFRDILPVFMLIENV